MPRFTFSKLVRDKIIEHQIASGASPAYRQLSPEEHEQALIEKIIEEAQEINTAPPEERASEIADVQQALDDLKERYGLSDENIKRAQIAKTEKNGAFKKGYFIDSVELDENDEWVAYYRQHADRYPEI